MKISLKQLSISLIAAAVIAVLTVFHYLGILRPVENIINRALMPAQAFFYNLSKNISGRYHGWQEVGELKQENQNLREQIAQQLIDRADYKILEEENKFLREQTNFSQANDYHSLAARVIGKNTQLAKNTITINRGRTQGVREGQPVLADNKIIVGKIIKISDYSAVALLINDHGSQLAASVLNSDKTMGVVKGEYGLGVKMELIPQTENIADGDIVVTSGIEAGVPRGLVIGTVERVSGDVEDLFKQAVIRLPIDFNKIYLVNVLISQTNASDND